MKLLTTLDPTRREHVESRLRTNLMAWFTSVDPDGRPDAVPVWFLWQADDDTFLVYSQPNKPKLRNLSENPNVAFGLDVTDIGRDIIRFDATAAHEPGHPPADRVAPYVAKYTERIAAIFGTPGDFAAAFSAPLVIRPSRARISIPSPGATAGA